MTAQRISLVLDVKRSTRFPASARGRRGRRLRRRCVCRRAARAEGRPSSRVLRITLRAGRRPPCDTGCLRGRGQDADPHRPGCCGPAALLRRAAWDEPAGHRQPGWRSWISMPSARVLRRACTRVSWGAVTRARARRGNRRRRWHDPGAARRRVRPERFIRPDVARHFEELPRGDLGPAETASGPEQWPDEVIRRQADDDADQDAV
jgi:hypothetical protein